MTRMSQCVADLKPFGHGFGSGIFQKNRQKGGRVLYSVKSYIFLKKISKYQRFSLGNLPQKTEGIVSARLEVRKEEDLAT